MCCACRRAGYVLLFAPARLGWRAESHLVATFGADNALAFALFNLLGLFPALLGCVAWPALRSYDKHKVGAVHVPALSWCEPLFLGWQALQLMVHMPRAGHSHMV